jgi:hypothetical protein
MPLLDVDQVTLALHAPAIAGDRAVEFDDAMARHGDGDAVCR